MITSSVFGRAIPNHNYDNALGELRNDPDDSIRAMASNIMYDHRVSMLREATFDRHVARPCTALSLRDGILDYYEGRVRTRRAPDFVYSRTNGSNHLTGSANRRRLIRADIQLVRIIVLNGLTRVLEWAKHERFAIAQSFPGASSPRIISKWLDGILGRRADRDRRAFSIAILRILNSYALIRAFQPTWATTWMAFEPFFSAGAQRWLEVLGVAPSPAISYPLWVVLLRYSAQEAGTLVRPTQLDAGWNAFHFPSPPVAALQSGGHPMDLYGSGSPAAHYSSNSHPLLPEMIHRQIAHKAEHFLAIGRVATPYANQIGELRKSHLSRLQGVYGPSVRAWMQFCT